MEIKGAPRIGYGHEGNEQGGKGRMRGDGCVLVEGKKVICEKEREL